MKRLIIAGALSLMVTLPMVGQTDQQTQFRTHLSFEYGAQLPGADLADRFGPNFNLASQFEVMHTGSLWHVGVKGLFLFGNEVKEDVLVGLRSDQGHVIGNDGAIASVLLRQRGQFGGAYIGKVFALSETNPRSGIKLSIGAGVLQHKIRVQDDSRSVVQLTGDYLKGYDRLSNGAALYAFVGYQNLDPGGRINFLVGCDLIVGKTQSRRDFDFASGARDTKQRSDFLAGFRVGWILPITTGKPPGEIYY